MSLPAADLDAWATGDSHGDIQGIALSASIWAKQYNRTPADQPAPRLLILGDILDRGQYMLVALFVVFALQLLYRDSVFLTAGNHESAMHSGGTFKHAAPDSPAYALHHALLAAGAAWGAQERTAGVLPRLLEQGGELRGSLPRVEVVKAMVQQERSLGGYMMAIHCESSSADCGAVLSRWVYLHAPCISMYSTWEARRSQQMFAPCLHLRHQHRNCGAASLPPCKRYNQASQTKPHLHPNIKPEPGPSASLRPP